jgi:hypothetical protein
VVKARLGEEDSSLFQAFPKKKTACSKLSCLAFVDDDDRTLFWYRIQQLMAAERDRTGQSRLLTLPPME